MTLSTAVLGSSRWIVAHGARQPVRRRLVCFPHAGGGASFFREWPALLPPTVELWVIQYPGRESRLREPFVDTMSALAGTIAGELEPHRTVPLVFFGHSMGSSVAYEVARRLEARRPGLVRHLVVSGRMAPHRQPVIPTEKMTHRKDDDGLVATLKRLGAHNVDLLEQQDVRSLILPAVRNDYRLIESYRPGPCRPLQMDVTACLGVQDHAIDEDDMHAWAEVTRGRFRLHRFPGDHFYLVPHRAEVLATLADLLAP
ncbi:thioesterase [Longimycelium tulufanense]|uniref:Thioesterase n=1 Tax=Longimycelium tulufanense TaxID=907463 RepID=A0A8J3FV56_9PSEU|nr:alpha/beta fold hydrolase [Longimycelium tulufanense]GGM49159.1 thioesterase [Longimycelium tulufanense]